MAWSTTEKSTLNPQERVLQQDATVPLSTQPAPPPRFGDGGAAPSRGRAITRRWTRSPTGARDWEMRDQEGQRGKVTGIHRCFNLKKENEKPLTHSHLHRANEAEVSRYLICPRPLAGPQKCIHGVICVCTICRRELFNCNWLRSISFFSNSATLPLWSCGMGKVRAFGSWLRGT